GVFTGWQQAARQTVPHCALGHVLTQNVTPAPDSPVTASRLYILRDSALTAKTARPRIPPDVTLPSPVPLAAAARRVRPRPRNAGRGHTVLRRVLTPARNRQPARHPAAGADVRLCPRRAPDGAV